MNFQKKFWEFFCFTSLWRTNRKDVEILIIAELAQGLWYFRRKLLPVQWWQHLFKGREIFALRKVYFKVNICLFIVFSFMFHHSEVPIILHGLHFYFLFPLIKQGARRFRFLVENVLWQQLRLKWFICSTLHNICEKFTEKVKCNIVFTDDSWPRLFQSNSCISHMNLKYYQYRIKKGIN